MNDGRWLFSGPTAVNQNNFQGTTIKSSSLRINVIMFLDIHILIKFTLTIKKEVIRIAEQVHFYL